MVRAIIEGRKTQTRRVITPRNDATRLLFFGGWTDGYVLDPGNEEWRQRAHGYAVGDLLWVKETHYLTDDGDFENVVYAEDTGAVEDHKRLVGGMQHQLGLSDEWAAPHLRLRPSIHMPRWASRTTLRVTDVRVQRLQDISDEDADAEGTAHCDQCHDVGWINEGPDGGRQCTAPGCGDAYVDCFRRYWDSINATRAEGAYSWDRNPWVVALTFETILKNVDEMM